MLGRPWNLADQRLISSGDQVAVLGVAKYVVVDMFAKACAGKSTKDVIAEANAQLKQIFKTA